MERGCVNSGFCCKVRPCPFGEPISETDNGCRFLVPLSVEDGKHPRFVCGIYDEIINKPGSELSPAFGAGCCSPLFNEDRRAIIKEEQNDG